MFKTRKQLLIRFLKENHIYNRIIKNSGFYTKDKILNDNILPRFFDYAFNWGSTVEGHNFWLKIQCEFILFILKNDTEDCFPKDMVMEYYKILLNSGYFHKPNMDKCSEYYLSFKEKYKKLFG